MARILSMTLVALLAAACVQVGPAPSGSPAAPSGSLAASPTLGTPSAPSVTAPPTSPSGTTEPTRTRRPRPQRTDRPTRPPTMPPSQLPTAPPTMPPAQPPTAPPTEPPLADLVIEDLTAPQSVEAGSAISIGFTIRNVGTAPSGAFAYSYDVGGGGGSTTVPSLLPGLLYAAYFDLGDADYANEVVTVSVVADSRDEVAESDEANNEASRQVQIICADPDLCP